MAVVHCLCSSPDHGRMQGRSRLMHRGGSSRLERAPLPVRGDCLREKSNSGAPPSVGLLAMPSRLRSRMRSTGNALKTARRGSGQAFRASLR
jgi:hypothetical protein